LKEAFIFRDGYGPLLTASASEALAESLDELLTLFVRKIRGITRRDVCTGIVVVFRQIAEMTGESNVPVLSSRIG